MLCLSGLAEVLTFGRVLLKEPLKFGKSWAWNGFTVRLKNRKGLSEFSRHCRFLY